MSSLPSRQRSSTRIPALSHAFPGTLLTSLLLLLLTRNGTPQTTAPPQPKGANIHTIFLTECNMYFQWQTIGVMYSHRKVGQPGPITRVMCCTDEQRTKLSQEYIDLAPTHFAPSYTVHPVTGDVYSAYNKPLAVIDYMEKKGDQIEEDFVLVMDADMLFRLPLIPAELGVKKGWATGAQFGYLKGVVNALAERHIPHVKPRYDREGGQPYGRKADQIGAFIVMHKEDLSRMARDWLKYTEDVRADPNAWNETGDQYAIHPGDKPWISEMYGYVFAAANNDIWHIADRTSMLYPEYQPIEPPRIIHYGLFFEIDDYQFDKHRLLSFDPLVCPPWDLNATKLKSGLFRHPPRPKQLKRYRTEKGWSLMKDLVAIETITTLNSAFCEVYEKKCPTSQQLIEECAKARQIELEVYQEYEKIDAIPFGSSESWCTDRHDNCVAWKERGECTNNPGYMLSHCQYSCGKCRHLLPSNQKWPYVADNLANGSKHHAKGFKRHERHEHLGQKGNPTFQKQIQDNIASIDQTMQDDNLGLKYKCLGDKSLTALQVGECVKAAEKGEDYFQSLGSRYDKQWWQSQEMQQALQTQQEFVGKIIDHGTQPNNEVQTYGFIFAGGVCAAMVVIIQRIRRKKRVNRSD